MKMIIMQGPPACGKSTWVKNFLEGNDPDYGAINRNEWVVVSRDSIRLSTGTYWVPDREKYITSLEDNAMKAALLNGLNVINDATNLNPKTIEHLESIARECEADIEFVSLYIPFKEAVSRDKERGQNGGLEVTEKVIKGFYQRYFPERLTQEIYTDKRYLEPALENVPSVVICDLDGTVAMHLSGRTPYEYERVEEDTPNWPMVATLRGLCDSGAKIIFVSGREKIGNCEAKTRAWINKYVMDARPYDLILREAGDHRKGFVVKKEIYENHIKDKYNVIHVFEDDTRCVKMYRELGLQCSQVYDFNMDLDTNYDK